MLEALMKATDSKKAFTKIENEQLKEHETIKFRFRSLDITFKASICFMQTQKGLKLN